MEMGTTIGIEIPHNYQPVMAASIGSLVFVGSVYLLKLSGYGVTQ